MRHFYKYKKNDVVHLKIGKPLTEQWPKRSFSTCTKFSEELTFLNPCYAHAH